MLLTMFSFYQVNFINIFIVLYHSSCTHFPYTVKIKEKFTGGRKGERTGQLISRTKRSHSKDQALACFVITSYKHLQSSPSIKGTESANLIRLYQKSAYNRAQTGLSHVQFSLLSCFVLSILGSGRCSLKVLKKQFQILN